ncbi:MAG TPA: DUF4331 domain-containing protein [Gaiellaceae bacterium]|jgi:hypothetical protein
MTAVTARTNLWVWGLALAALAATLLALPRSATAASHREAPLIAMDPEADITDFFMFRSYEPGKSDKVDLIMDVIPGEEPSSGPNYFNFDPNVDYVFNVDNDADGKANDLQFRFRFTSEFRGTAAAAGLFLPYVGAAGSPLPAITTLDSPGLGFRQHYSVELVEGGGVRTTTLADGLVAVPSNVGPRTMPDYDALTRQGVYDLGHGMRVFAGQRDDPFAIDLGAVFDTLNLRAPGTDMLSGFNVHSIALELPASMLTADGRDAAHTAYPKLGAYAETARPRVTILGRDGDERTREDMVQVQRLANPLVNEAIIGTIDKDRWNATDPEDESQFLDYYLNPRLALALQIVFGASAPVSNRTDLVDLLLKYAPGDRRLSELLRLNLSVAPKPLSQQQPLTVLAGDNAGWPNGRRPIDDVTDIAVKVVGGPNFAGAGDGVTLNDKPLPTAFPFLASPWDGRNRQHANP